MLVSFQPQDSTLNVKLEGDLIGGADAMTFSQSLKEAIAGGGELQEVVLDVSTVGFVNSSGLGMLLSARQAATEAGATLKVKKPGEQLRSLLELTKLSDLLGVA